jgi:RIO-like serine/threonine protein kinase
MVLLIFKETHDDAFCQRSKLHHYVRHYRTVSIIGVWSQLSDKDIQKLDSLLNAGWEVPKTVNVGGSMGFTAHEVFILRRPVG